MTTGSPICSAASLTSWIECAADVFHRTGKELAILSSLNGADVASYDLYVVALQDTASVQLHRAVEGGLPSHVWQQRVGALPLDDALHGARRYGLYISARCRLGVCHDGRGI